MIKSSSQFVTRTVCVRASAKLLFIIPEVKVERRGCFISDTQWSSTYTDPYVTGTQVTSGCKPANSRCSDVAVPRAEKTICVVLRAPVQSNNAPLVATAVAVPVFGLPEPEEAEGLHWNVLSCERKGASEKVIAL